MKPHARPVKLALQAAALAFVLAGEVHLDGAQQQPLRGALVPEAHAVVGRPLTPVSVAGTARRTARRTVRRTSVYAATLPKGCSAVTISGSALHQCGSTYYQASGSQYVVVEVD
jgi:hypothetical protein